MPPIFHQTTILHFSRPSEPSAVRPSSKLRQPVQENHPCFVWVLVRSSFDYHFDAHLVGASFETRLERNKYFAVSLLSLESSSRSAATQPQYSPAKCRREMPRYCQIIEEDCLFSRKDGGATVPIVPTQPLTLSFTIFNRSVFLFPLISILLSDGNIFISSL